MTEAQELEAEAARYKGLAVLAASDGGKELISNMKDRIAADVESLSGLLKGSDADIRAAIAQLRSDVYVYRVLVNAEQNAKIAMEELESLLKRQDTEA